MQKVSIITLLPTSYCIRLFEACSINHLCQCLIDSTADKCTKLIDSHWNLNYSQINILLLLTFMTFVSSLFPLVRCGTSLFVLFVNSLTVDNYFALIAITITFVNKIKGEERWVNHQSLATVADYVHQMLNASALTFFGMTIFFLSIPIFSLADTVYSTKNYGYADFSFMLVHNLYICLFLTFFILCCFIREILILIVFYQCKILSNHRNLNDDKVYHLCRVLGFFADNIKEVR